MEGSCTALLIAEHLEITYMKKNRCEQILNKFMFIIILIIITESDPGLQYEEDSVILLFSQFTAHCHFVGCRIRWSRTWRDGTGAEFRIFYTKGKYLEASTNTRTLFDDFSWKLRKTFRNFFSPMGTCWRQSPST